MTIHFLLRHAESEANKKGNDEVAATMAQREIGLTAEGVAQAEELARKLNKHCGDHGITELIVRYSPFVRTRQTWEAMRPFLTDVTILMAAADERIAEITFLPRGQTGTESLFPEYPRYLADETVAQIDHRLSHYLSDMQELAQQHPKAAILTILHSTPMRIAAAMLRGIDDIQDMDVQGRPGNVALWKTVRGELKTLFEGHWPPAAKSAPKPDPRRVAAVEKQIRAKQYSPKRLK